MNFMPRSLDGTLKGMVTYGIPGGDSKLAKRIPQTCHAKEIGLPSLFLRAPSANSHVTGGNA
jgi:hypothetical protein